MAKKKTPASGPKRAKKRKGGSKRAYTVAQVELALRNAAGMVTAAARALGCSPKTVYRYIERSPTLKDVLEEVREKHLDIAEAQLLKAIRDGDLRAVMFYLRCQGKARGWHERMDVTVQGDPEQPVQHEHKHDHVLEVNDEDRAKEIARILQQHGALAGVVGEVASPDDPAPN